jgi:hypothetical protein
VTIVNATLYWRPSHFQGVARGHSAVRRFERVYRADAAPAAEHS